MRVVLKHAFTEADVGRTIEVQRWADAPLTLAVVLRVYSSGVVDFARLRKDGTIREERVNSFPWFACREIGAGKPL